MVIQQQPTPPEDRGYTEVGLSMNIAKTLSQLRENKVFDMACGSLKESCPTEYIWAMKDTGPAQEKSKKIIPLQKTFILALSNT